MTSQDDPQRTVGGLGGRAVDTVKQVLGEAGDSDERARDRLADRVAAEQAQTEQLRAASEQRAAAPAANEHAANEHAAADDVERAPERFQTGRSVQAAEDARFSAAQEANRLERAASPREGQEPQRAAADRLAAQRAATRAELERRRS